MSERNLDEYCAPCSVRLQRLTAVELIKICKPYVVSVEKLSDTLFEGLSGRQLKVFRSQSAQKMKFERKFFAEERFDYAKEKAKYIRERRIALTVSQRSACKRNRARPTKSKNVDQVTPDSQPAEIVERRNLFLAYSEMLAKLTSGGEVSHLLKENESFVVNSLLELPNCVRAKIVEFTARTSSWVRVDSEEISPCWLERLVDSGIVSVAADFPAEYSDILNSLTVPELKSMCQKAGLSSNFSKQSLIRELSITQYLDVNVLQMSPENHEIYDLRKIVRVTAPVRNIIIKTAHMFLLPISDTNVFWSLSNPIYRIVRPCLPLNPELESIKFDGYSRIFKNNEELTRWAEARQTKFLLEKAIARKKWEVVENTLLNISTKHFVSIPCSQSSEENPEIFRQFTEKNVEIETLSLGVQALVSSNQSLELAEEILRDLLDKPNRLPEEKCSWRYHLTVVLEKLSKTAAAVDMARYAGELACENCQVCRTKLRRLYKRLSLSEILTSSEITKSTKDKLLFQPVTVVIKKKHSGKGFPGLKSVYSIIKNGKKLHLSVEEYVMEYFSKNRYPKGVDDEGRWIMNLCNLLIWEETFSKDVPNVFCASWQSAPLDWGTQHFWLARKSKLEEKLNVALQMTAEELSIYLLRKRDRIGRVMSTVDWYHLHSHPKAMLTCLTVPLFVAICKRLISGGRNARHGFPDLFLWNEEEKKCLFVEVKGRNDKLTSFQRSWIQFIKNSQGDALVAEVFE